MSTTKLVGELGNPLFLRELPGPWRCNVFSSLFLTSCQKYEATSAAFEAGSKMPPRSRSFGANLLPRGDSPQLGPFKDSDADVEFVRLLSKIDYTEIGGHAHVFEVLINSQTYALKIVRTSLV